MFVLHAKCKRLFLHIVANCFDGFEELDRRDYGETQVRILRVR